MTPPVPFFFLKLTTGRSINLLYRPFGCQEAHDWAVDQLADIFRTTHKDKTHQVVKRRGQPCGDIELVGYLSNVSNPVSLVLDLRVPHDRVGSRADPALNGSRCDIYETITSTQCLRGV
jgi:hypothetical protein